jgi:hypothetical protein
MIDWHDPPAFPVPPEFGAYYDTPLRPNTSGEYRCRHGRKPGCAKCVVLRFAADEAYREAIRRSEPRPVAFTREAAA